MYADRAKNSLGAGAGVVLKSLKWAIFKHCLTLNFFTINNEVEDEAFIVGLRSLIRSYRSISFCKYMGHEAV